MSISKKQLGQARENSTNAVSVYSPPEKLEATIKSIRVCNTSGAAATVRMFIDHDGTTYDETTAIVWDMVVPIGGAITDTDIHYMNLAAGNLAYRSSVANALTITVEGEEERK